MLLLSIDHNLVAVAIVVAKKARCEKRSENHQRFYNLIRLEIFNQKMTIVDLRREIDFVFVKKKGFEYFNLLHSRYFDLFHKNYYSRYATTIAGKVYYG